MRFQMANFSTGSLHGATAKADLGWKINKYIVSFISGIILVHFLYSIQDEGKGFWMWLCCIVTSWLAGLAARVLKCKMFCHHRVSYAIFIFMMVFCLCLLPCPYVNINIMEETSVSVRGLRCRRPDRLDSILHAWTDAINTNTTHWKSSVFKFKQNFHEFDEKVLVWFGFGVKFNE